MPECFAHSENPTGRKHALAEHLRGVAELARGFAVGLHASDVAYWAGLCHDLGKFHPDFQSYLNSADHARGPDHSSAGMVFAAAADPIAFVVAGHHAGLQSLDDLKKRLRKKSDANEVRQALRIATSEIAELANLPPILEMLPAHLRASGVKGREADDLKRSTEFFLRMLFSALVDADFLDTEKHFQGARIAVRGATVPLKELWTRFEENQDQLTSQAAGELNHIRNEIYRSCLAAAKLAPGFFRLTVPTGGGKTRSGMAFGLRHGILHGMERVVVAIPYTSIIEQTADVYRGIFGAEDGAVLEHHSAVHLPEIGKEPVTCAEAWPRLAAENWEAPVVVTTTVQLFESLFANRPGGCRKLHNLARSVIVLDEVQTLPYGLLAPILDALRELVANYGATIVLSTATQPALIDGPYLRGLPDAREIVPDPARYFAALKRVEYEITANAESWSWAQVADRMRREPQALAIVNTKKDALALLDALDDPAALHLSTLLCGAHRRRVLGEVKQRLAAGEPCRLVSTQVVEAGVDLDFPLVLRAMGPLDRIVQAAGRCNREGRLPLGRVVVFRPDEGGAPPGDYRTGLDTAAAILAHGCDLADPRAYEEYFQRLFQAVEMDRQDIQECRTLLDFPEVAKRFQMIPDDSTAVVVRPQENASEVDRLIERLSRQDEPPRWVFQRLQPYLVNVPARVLAEYEQNGLVQEVVPGLHLWLGLYDPIRGIVARGQDPENLVI